MKEVQRNGMKDLIKEFLENHNASSAPCEHIANQLMLDGRWSDLDCPSKTQVKNFVQAHFSRKKQEEQHALSRRGKRSYIGFSLQWLKDEIRHRNMEVSATRITRGMWSIHLHQTRCSANGCQLLYSGDRQIYLFN